MNLFLGSNGAGKTNLLEALSVLATGVSPRGAEPETMVQWEAGGFAIAGDFASAALGDGPVQEPIRLEMKYRSGASRVIRENGVTAVRLRDLVGRVPLVSFVPEDLSMVKGEPELRRRALNLVLLQADRLYAETLRQYQDVVKARNAALRQLEEGSLPSGALRPWDEALIELGLQICRSRAEFVQEFSPEVSRVHERVTGGKETSRLEYRPSFGGPWDAQAPGRWHEILARTRPQELAIGSTLTGPHRDDMIFILNDRPARVHASEGQKRTCAVAFKLAELPYIQRKLGQKPICLLDDVLSELDAERAHHLLHELSRTGQCFVTMTGLESWPREFELPASIFRVNENSVRREAAPRRSREPHPALS